MIFRRALCALLAALLIGGGAEAYVRSGATVMPSGHHRLKTPGGPPLNGFTTPTGAYGFRLLRTAYLGTGAALRIRRTSDNLELDVGFAGDGSWDNASAAAHCAATTCFVTTWYDQSGNGRHLLQAVAVNQPQIIFACQNGMACHEMTLAAQLLTAAVSITPATGLVSMSAVANRVTGLGNCTWMRENGNVNRFLSRNVANNWQTAGSTGSVFVTANDATWHSGQGVLNGASSVVNIDGVETTGTVTGGTALGVLGILGAATTTCRQTEAVVWDNYALTAGERSSLVANQRGFWGF